MIATDVSCPTHDCQTREVTDDVWDAKQKMHCIRLPIAVPPTGSHSHVIHHVCSSDWGSKQHKKAT